MDNSSQARLVSQVSDGLDDLFDNLEYNFGELLKPSEIYDYLERDFGRSLSLGWKMWYVQGDKPWQ